MATVVRARVPAEEFVLYETLRSHPALQIECERIVESGDVVMPLVWARGVERDLLESTLDDDDSVDSLECLAEFDTELLYRMEWVSRVDLVVQMLTTSGATVMNAYGDGDDWELRVLYPEREDLARTTEFCEEHGLRFDVLRVRDLEGEPAGRYGLTNEQYEALTLAIDRGYFDVPRAASLDGLADELDISHQALSERLRRGHEALIEETLVVGPDHDRAADSHER